MTEDYFETRLRNSYGIDKTYVLLKIMEIIEAPNVKKGKSVLNRFKSFLVQQLKRGLKQSEDLNFKKGIMAYIETDPESNERMDAINYLMELKFLEQ